MVNDLENEDLEKEKMLAITRFSALFGTCKIMLLAWTDLALIAPFMTIVAFVASVDQGQSAQNVQPDLLSTLYTSGKHV